jgi:hypothetical protein
MRIEIINKYTDNTNWYYDVNLYNQNNEMVDRYSGIVFNYKPTNLEVEERCINMFNTMNVTITEDNITFL